MGLSTFHIEAPPQPVWVPMPAASKFHLCPAVGETKDCRPSLRGRRSTSRGLSSLRRSKIEKCGSDSLLPAE